ncbi:MAG: thiamine-phosphate kinase [Neisseria sp.]|nr:thiamine-phosphate kinase [Neisseria sp.]
MKEFDFIRAYLADAPRDETVLLGIGDDAAVVRPQLGYDLCISSDMLLEGRHFFAGTPPQDVAHKVLAVNVSDMAAMGAVPRWVSLSVALPELQADWLNGFCQTWFALCRQYGISLIGGDTTKGNGVFSVNIIGEVPQGKGLQRGGARVGEDIWVSGRIGSAAWALQHLLGNCVLPAEVFAECETALLRPQPRVALGRALLDIASAAQDISDGLVQDLGHIATASGCAAEIRADAVPVLPELAALMPSEKMWQTALTGGDDYELLFTAPPEYRDAVQAAAVRSNTPVSRIGVMKTGAGVSVLRADGSRLILDKQGFDHFG